MHTFCVQFYLLIMVSERERAFSLTSQEFTLWRFCGVLLVWTQPCLLWTRIPPVRVRVGPRFGPSAPRPEHPWCVISGHNHVHCSWGLRALGPVLPEISKGVIPFMLLWAMEEEAIVFKDVLCSPTLGRNGQAVSWLGLWLTFWEGRWNLVLFNSISRTSKEREFSMGLLSLLSSFLPQVPVPVVGPFLSRILSDFPSHLLICKRH